MRYVMFVFVLVSVLQCQIHYSPHNAKRQFSKFLASQSLFGTSAAHLLADTHTNLSLKSETGDKELVSCHFETCRLLIKHPRNSSS